MKRRIADLAVLVIVVFVASCTHLRSFADLPRTEGVEIEECLIDFSQKMAALPPDRLSGLNRDKFFAILAPDYPSDKTCLTRVAAYPVFVRPEGGSYIITVCEKQRQWALFEDDGATLDRVDRAFVREGKEVHCPVEATR
jgi:hypothetical protein